MGLFSGIKSIFTAVGNSVEAAADVINTGTEIAQNSLKEYSEVSKAASVERKDAALLSQFNDIEEDEEAVVKAVTKRGGDIDKLRDKVAKNKTW